MLLHTMREIHETEDLSPAPDSAETVLLYGLEHRLRSEFADWIARHRRLAWVVCPWNGRRSDFCPGTLIVLPDRMDPAEVFGYACRVRGVQPALLHIRRALLDIAASMRARLDPPLALSRGQIEGVAMGQLDVVFPDNARETLLDYLRDHPERFRDGATSSATIDRLEAAIAPGWIETRRESHG